MTEPELETALLALFTPRATWKAPGTPRADEVIARILAAADCDASRSQVLAAVERGLIVAQYMAEAARVTRDAAEDLSDSRERAVNRSRGWVADFTRAVASSDQEGVRLLLEKAHTGGGHHGGAPAAGRHRGARGSGADGRSYRAAGQERSER